MAQATVKIRQQRAIALKEVARLSEWATIVKEEKELQLEFESSVFTGKVAGELGFQRGELLGPMVVADRIILDPHKRSRTCTKAPALLKAKDFN